MGEAEENAGTIVVCRVVGSGVFFKSPGKADGQLSLETQVSSNDETGYLLDGPVHYEFFCAFVFYFARVEGKKYGNPQRETDS